jgi:hypothetical protein
MRTQSHSGRGPLTGEGAEAAAEAPFSSPEDQREAERRSGLQLSWEIVPTAVAFLFVYAVLFYFFRPDLMLSVTTTSGGDMGAHHYPAKFLIDELVTRFRLTGWTMGWYAGMPMFTFYLPLPFLLIAVLNVFLPYAVSFKLATVTGVFLLPASAYIFGRLMRLREPFPALAAVFALAFLLMESYSIYGANILSTLAGEFGYSISFALALLFLGTLNRGLEEPRYEWLFALNAVLLAAIVLSHIVTIIVLCIVAPAFIVLHRTRGALVYLAAVFGVAFFLSAFWGLPFMDKLSWTAHMSWGQLQGIGEILPTEIRWVAALAVLGLGYAVSSRELRLIPLVWMAAAMVILYYTLPDGRLWNGRLLPFYYFSLHMLAAYAGAWLLRPFVVMIEDLLVVKERQARNLYVPLAAIAIVVAVAAASTTAAGWIKWNYEGYENKDAWPEHEQIMRFIGSLEPQGRVMWEHSPRLDKFGTPRMIELVPYWTEQWGMEGTLMESAFTAPYHFINQAELSLEPSHAIIGVDYPPRNVADGISHLQFMNIPYLVAASDEVAAEVENDTRAELLASIDVVSIFRISDTSRYVEVMRNEPVKVRTDDWRATIVPWYKNVESLQVPVIWDRGEAALGRFTSIRASEAAAPPAQPLVGGGEVLSEEIEEDRLTFETTAIGQPHWVKVSYFPNWKVEGAEGPFVASPSFMMVIPTQSEVTLHYGRTWSNNLGQFLTATGWLIVLAVLALPLWRRYRSPGAD